MDNHWASTKLFLSVTLATIAVLSLLPSTAGAQCMTVIASTTLAGNVVCPAGTGIRVNTQGITLNLNGFSVIGQGTGAIGIEVPPPNGNVTITNGKVEGFDVGIMVGVTNPAQIETFLTRITNLDVNNSAVHGIQLGSAHSTLIQNVKVSNTGTGAGIFAEDSNGSLVLDSQVVNSSNVGIDVVDTALDVDSQTSAPVIVDSSTITNADFGIRATEAGLIVRQGTKITGCPTCRFGIRSILGSFSNLVQMGGLEVDDTQIKKFTRAGIAVDGSYQSTTIVINNTSIKSIGDPTPGVTLGGMVFDHLVLPIVLSSTVAKVQQGPGIGVYCSGISAVRFSTVKGAEHNGIVVSEQGGPSVCDTTLNHGSHLIDGNTLKGNGLDGIGIFADDFNRVVGNTVKGSGNDGVLVLMGANHTVESNTLKGNGASGLHLFNVTDTVVSLNQASKNGNDGFDLLVGISTTVTSNSSSKNADWGFSTTTAVNDGGGNSAAGNGTGQCNPAHMAC